MGALIMYLAMGIPLWGEGMKIETISLYHLRMELITPFETSFGRIDTRDCILLKIEADGITGYGECAADRDPGYSYETCGTAWHIYTDFIAPMLIGKCIDQPAQVQDLFDWINGHNMAKAGIEMALWDIYGKQQGRSLMDLLGGQKQQVPVGVSVGIQQSPESLARVVQDYLEQGYRRVKIKIKPGKDVAETSYLRCRFPELQLQVDANSAYRLEDAHVLKPLDDLQLLLIEQPLAADDIWDHSRLQADFNTPICLDESILNRRHARQAIEMKAARVINIKPGRVGGLSEAVAIHDLCQLHDIPVWCGGMLETGVGRASNLAIASLSNFRLPGDISASERYYSLDITNESFTLNPDSTITVPQTPGLGVSINNRSLDEFTLRRQVFP